MNPTPKFIEERYTRFVTALETLAPLKSFAGYTLTELEAQVADSNASRRTLSAMEDSRKQVIISRDSIDQITMQICDAIVKAVVADPDYGDDSALYEALGYIRKSDRKSGLTRKTNEPKKK